MFQGALPKGGKGWKASLNGEACRLQLEETLVLLPFRTSVTGFHFPSHTSDTLHSAFQDLLARPSRCERGP